MSIDEIQRPVCPEVPEDEHLQQYSVSVEDLAGTRSFRESTALLVLLPAAAGAGIISSDLNVS